MKTPALASFFAVLAVVGVPTLEAATPLRGPATNSNSGVRHSGQLAKDAFNATEPFVYDRSSCATAILSGAGVPISKTAALILVGWMQAETGTGPAGGGMCNPLGCTLPMPGSKDCAKCTQHSVQDYASAQQGCDAITKTLTSSSSSYGYGAIIKALKEGDAKAACNAIDSSSWGTSDSCPCVEEAAGGGTNWASTPVCFQ